MSHNDHEEGSPFEYGNDEYTMMSEEGSRFVNEWGW